MTNSIRLFKTNAVPGIVSLRGCGNLSRREFLSLDPLPIPSLLAQVCHDSRFHPPARVARRPRRHQVVRRASGARAGLGHGRARRSHRDRRAQRHGQDHAAAHPRGLGTARFGFRRMQSAERDRRLPPAGARPSPRRDAARVPRAAHRCRRRRSRARARRANALAAGDDGADDAYTHALERFLALGGPDFDGRVGAGVRRARDTGTPADPADRRALRRRGRARVARGDPALALRRVPARRAHQRSRLRRSADRSKSSSSVCRAAR